MYDAGVRTMSMSFVGLTRRIKHPERWSIADHFPDDVEIFLDSGAFTVNRRGEEVSFNPLDMANAYMAFVAQNIDRLSLVSEMDVLSLGEDWINGVREDFWEEAAGDKFLPIWHASTGTAELSRLAEKYQLVGVLQSGLEQDLTAVLNRLARNGARLHGVSMTRMDAMRQVQWDSVQSLSWISPMSNGDTIIWVGNELKRYPRKYKDDARRRHRTYIRDTIGLDAEKIAADDSKEVLKLSLWSWERFVEDINDRVRSPFGPVTTPGSGENGSPEDSGPEGVSTQDGASGRSELALREPRRRETFLLPIIDIDVQETPGSGGEDGEDDLVKDKEVVIRSRSDSLMQCNTCFVKDKCPKFEPDAACAFLIPATVRTVTQRRSAMDALVEMQLQRVLRMSMFEQLEGGYADTNLSGEIDRMMKLIEKRDAADMETVKWSSGGEVKASAGAINAIWGKEATQLTALPEAVDAGQLMKESDIVDGEVAD